MRELLEGHLYLTLASCNPDGPLHVVPVAYRFAAGRFSLATSSGTRKWRNLLPDSTPDFIVRVPHGYVDRARIAADLDAGGLSLRDIETVRLQGSATSARALAEGFCLGTPLRFELQERGPLEELTSAVADQLVARLGDGPLRGDLTAFVVSAQHRP